MNWSLVTADRATYRKIVAVALLGATLMTLAAIWAQQQQRSWSTLSGIHQSAEETVSC